MYTPCRLAFVSEAENARMTIENRNHLKGSKKKKKKKDLLVSKALVQWSKKQCILSKK